MAQRPAISSSLVLAFFLLGLAALAGAQDTEAGGRRAAALHWVRLPGAEDCSGGDALSRAVEAKLRREVFPAPRDASVLVEGHVERTSDGYRAALQMRASDGDLLGSRELSSKARNCDELSETIAVVLAVMIDPEGAHGKASSRPEPPADATHAGARLPQRIVGFTRVALGMYEVNAPNGGALWGGGLAYEISLRSWGGLRVEAAGFRNEISLVGEVTPGRPPRIQLAYVGLGYCPLWLTTGRLRSSACASGELGGFHTSEGRRREDEPPPLVHATVSLQARLALRLFGPIEVQVGGSFSSLLIDSPFESPTRGYTIAPNRFHGSVDLGIGVRFGGPGP